jgi:hypothetical protein
MIWLLAHPLPPLPSVTSTGDTLRKRGNLLTGRVGEELNYATRKKAWSSINHSVLSERKGQHVFFIYVESAAERQSVSLPPGPDLSTFTFCRSCLRGVIKTLFDFRSIVRAMSRSNVTQYLCHQDLKNAN